ncbi:MAG: MoxR family ATPase [Vicinamibacterales bacterium]
MTVTEHPLEQAALFRDCFTRLRSEIGRVFVGQPSVVEQLLLCFFCQGHGLIEGAPGLGKTLLVRSLSEALSLRFARVQCTPDLMPADITGTNVMVDSPDRTHRFLFQPGPIFANIVLADEINRATPRTQSAFLEAMQERHVTVFGTTNPIAPPFSLFATQNPVEMEGTYPLPEAQLDRFFFKLTVSVPEVDELAEIMARTTGDEEPRVAPLFGADVAQSLFTVIRHVKIADPVLRYGLRILRATHPQVKDAPESVRKYVRYGASPRGAQAMVLAAKALALLAGRFHVAIEDLRQVALPALNHRIIRNFHAEVEQVPADSLVADVLASVVEE